MKSDNIKKGIAHTPHRGLLMAAGVSRKNMNAPFIGIASSFTDLIPHLYLEFRQFATV